MNSVVLMGRLTKDPDVRTSQNGVVSARFTLAVDRPFKAENGQKEADFIPCVAWGKSAELIGNSCAKGHRLFVEGRLQIRNYEGKDGQKRYVAEVIVNSFEFIERKSDAQPKMTNMGKEVPFDSEEVVF